MSRLQKNAQSGGESRARFGRTILFLSLFLLLLGSLALPSATAETGAATSSPSPAPTEADAATMSAPASSPSPTPSPDRTLHSEPAGPAAPTVLTPTAGEALPFDGALFSGTGSDGSEVTVFAGPHRLCSSEVTNGEWSCRGGGLPGETYLVSALEQDAAGAYGPGSPATSLLFLDAGESAPTPPTATATPTPTAVTEAPAGPAPTASATTPDAAGPTTSASPGAGPSPSATASASASATEPPQLVPDGGNDSDSTQPPSAAGNQPPAAGQPWTGAAWASPTSFTANVLPSRTGLASPWLHGVLLAIGSLLLLGIPFHLLTRTLSRFTRERPVRSKMSLTGRNQERQEFETSPVISVARWVLPVATLLVAGLSVLMTGPIGGEPAYLRLFLAVITALVLVNATAALLPRWWASWLRRQSASPPTQPVTVSFVLAPHFLLLVAGTALVSRLLELQPAFLFGLLGSLAVAGGTAACRGQLAAVRVGGIIVLALTSMLLLKVLPAPSGVASTFTVELANTMVLAATGSAALALIPWRTSSGRQILAWSPLAWASLTVAAGTVVFAVFSPTVAAWHGSSLEPVVSLAAAVFAVSATAVWAWQHRLHRS